MRFYRDGRQIYESPQEVHLIREEGYECNSRVISKVVVQKCV